jgi:hypothetical protein
MNIVNVMNLKQLSNSASDLNVSTALDYILRTAIIILDGSIVNNLPLYESDKNIIKCIFNFDSKYLTFVGFMKIINMLITQNINTFSDKFRITNYIHTPGKYYHVIEFFDNNSHSDYSSLSEEESSKVRMNIRLIKTMYIYNTSFINYSMSNTECYFDCNTTITEYYGVKLMDNIYSKFNLNVEDITKRSHAYRFCYTSDDMKNFGKCIMGYDILEQIASHSEYINRINYARKLILNKWIMDEFLYNSYSWTVNYWDTYLNNIRMVKLQVPHISEEIIKLNTSCKLCHIKFNLQDVVWSQMNIYIHVDCIVSFLLK